MVAVPALAAPKQAPAPADDPKKAAAKQFYEAGQLLYERGEFIDAAKEFERAYGESPLPDLLYNIGQAYDKGGERKMDGAEIPWKDVIGIEENVAEEGE